MSASCGGWVAQAPARGVLQLVDPLRCESWARGWASAQSGNACDLQAGLCLAGGPQWGLRLYRGLLVYAGTSARHCVAPCLHRKGTGM